MTIYRCSVIGVADGVDQWQYGMHLSKAAGSIDGAMAAWQAAITLMWNGDGGDVVGLSGYYPGTTTIQSLVVTALDPVTGKNVEQLQSGGVSSGISTDHVLPGEVAMCVSLRTALPTRAGRGRFYLPNPVNTTVVGGLYVHAFVLDALAAAKGALDSLVTSTYVPVIYHSGPKTSTPITSVDVGNVPDSQRRRRNKLIETRETSAL